MFRECLEDQRMEETEGCPHTQAFKPIFGNKHIKKEGISSFLGTTLVQNQEKISTMILFLYIFCQEGASNKRK